MKQETFGWIFLGVMIGLAMLGLFGCHATETLDNYCPKVKPFHSYCPEVDDACSADDVLPKVVLDQIEKHNADWCGSCHPTKCKDE